MTAGIILAITIIYLNLNKAIHIHLNTWTIIASIVVFVRIALWFYYQKHPINKANSRQRLFTLLAIVSLTGTLWGVAGVMFFDPSTPNNRVLLILVYGYLVAGSTATITSVCPLFLVYPFLSISPLGLFLIFHEDPSLKALGASICIFLLLNVLMVINREREVVKMFRLTENNQKLIAELLEQKYLAEQSNRGKTELLAAISHDLRQPMHAMGLFLNGLHPFVSQSGEEVFNKVQNSAGVLRNLFNGLLDLSRLDANAVKLHKELIDLSSFLQKIVFDFSAEAQEKGLHLESKIEEVGVYTDPILLERVIRNLMANAIQYTDSGLVCLMNSVDKGFVTIAIQDEGRGIPEEELNNIFSEYHQLNNAERDRSKGVGLGLAIVHRICELLSIPIQVKSRLGKGSTFSVKLAVANSPLIESQPIQKAKPLSLKGELVVLVDDEQDIRDGTERLLKSWGCGTIVAATSKRVMSQLEVQKTVPSILIVDYHLIGELGTDVIAQVRDQYKQNIPAMIITGDTTKKFSNILQDDNIAVLYKPFSPVEFRKTVNQLIRRITDKLT